MHTNGLVCRLALSRVLRRLLWLLDRVLGPRVLKMAEDGPKMAPRWPQDGPKLAPRWPNMGHKRSWKWLSIDEVVQK